MEWSIKAKEVLEKIKGYRQDNDGWKQAKKMPEVSVWEKQSPDWNGMLYRVEGIVNTDPETAFSYIDPAPTSPRSEWDKAIKEIQLIEQIDLNVSVVRTITYSAFAGLISSRDFTDIVVNESTDEYLATNARAVEHPGCPPSSDLVRGINYPCAIICFRVPEQPKRTKITSYIQTDLGGMLPKALVENALPSNQVDFFMALRKILQDDGKWDGSANESA